jgi:hypothetical protein
MMDENSGIVLCTAFITSIFWLPILLIGIADIVNAWRDK